MLRFAALIGSAIALSLHPKGTLSPLSAARARDFEEVVAIYGKPICGLSRYVFEIATLTAFARNDTHFKNCIQHYPRYAFAEYANFMIASLMAELPVLAM